MTWATATLGDVCHIVSGATPKTAEKRYWGGDILWTTPKDLSDLEGAYIERSPRTITDEGLRSCAASLLPANSVLLSSRAPIGLVAINTVPMATNQGFKSLIPNQRKLDSKFLFHWLKSKTSHLQGLGNGATFKEISKSIVERIEIPLPPLDEQRRIAAILDKAGALRRKRKRAIDLIDSLNHFIFIEIFGNPHQRSNTHPVVEVGAVASCIVPGRDKPKSFTGGIPWITTGEVNHLTSTDATDSKCGLSPDEIDEVKAKIIPAKSVILTCVGDLGVTSVVTEPMVINQQLHSFQCSKSIMPEYLMFALSYQKKYMYKRATKTTLPYMNKSVCNSIPILLPPIEQQNQFGRLIDQSSSLRRSMFSSLAKIDAVFSSLQHRAFSGQL